MTGPSRSTCRAIARDVRAPADRDTRAAFCGFGDQILSLYARGLTVREIQAFLADIYALEGSPDLNSTVAMPWCRR